MARLALGLGAVAVLLMPAAALGYRMGLIPLGIALGQAMRWAAYLGIAAIVAALIGVARSSRRPGRRVPVALAGLALGVLAAGVPLLWQRTARGSPPIHDITTDTLDPPAFDAIVPLRANAPNSFAYDPAAGAEQRQAYPDVVPATLAMPLDAAFERALATAREAGWEIVAADAQAGRIEATDTTFWYGFKDDVVIRLTPVHGGTRVDVRSVSRVGRGDAGTNARRIREYLAALQDRG